MKLDSENHLNQPGNLPQLVDQVIENTQRHLLAQRNREGHWSGFLSSSALSTATATMALSSYHRSGRGSSCERTHWEELCNAGWRWLVENQNNDGGWGDTTKSFSNISTTALVWAALPTNDPRFEQANAACQNWLIEEVRRSSQGRSAKHPDSHDEDRLDPHELAQAIRQRYGKDHTFSVPILTALALRSRLGELPKAWKDIPQLPFELAAFPRAWYAKLRLRVVSYALPALIAIGLVRFRQFPGPNPVMSALRRGVTDRVLKILREIQPESGGYLEAIPLTSFVTMSLIEAGLEDCPVVPSGIDFLVHSFRNDGSWAIDTNLATWATTLAINSLQQVKSVKAKSARQLTEKIDSKTIRNITRWLLDQQYKTVHPFTRAAPGGWAWTDLSGGVPDADDTPGALLALALLSRSQPELRRQAIESATAGVKWLLQTQNRDGGMPTFCKGWGQLPFDRSSSDLTAHAIRAWDEWYPELPALVQADVRSAMRKGVLYLLGQQRDDGSFVPLWFGNQHLEQEENPVYGTSRVLLAWANLIANRSTNAAESRTRYSHIDWERWWEAGLRAWRWMLDQQNADGGWGGGNNGNKPAVRRGSGQSVAGATSPFSPGTETGGSSPVCPMTGTCTSIEETGLALEAVGACWNTLFSLVQTHSTCITSFDESGRLDLMARTHAAIDRACQALTTLTNNGTAFPSSPIGFYFAKLWYYEKTYPIVFALNGLRNSRPALDAHASSDLGNGTSGRTFQ